ncbi:MAG: glycosyltransferase [Oscillospiraceae bacterium]|nr:glycosyltransferase [Oscillospiraceae bacterium]
MQRDILLINDRLDAGGVETILQNLSAYLAARGDRLTIWAHYGDRETLARKYPAGVSYRRLPFWDGASRRFGPKWFFQRACRVLFEGFLLRLKRWDAVAAFKEGPSMRLAAKLRAKKKLAWIHADYSQFHWSACNFRSDADERECMARFSRVVCVSEAVRRSVADTVGDPGNLCTLYSPINAPAILKAAADHPADCVHPAGKPLLVSVGRLAEVKRYDMLIDICAELEKELDFDLWIVGGGELEAELREKLRASGARCVKLLGARENPYPYIACADWLVSSSRSESYGLTIQEALLLGVPIAAASCPAVAETLDRRFGVLSEPDRGSLSAALREILSHPELGVKCRENIRAFYDRDSLWEKRLAAVAALFDG